jgi:glycosyltransferase involved in cell wall biosynthesis
VTTAAIAASTAEGKGLGAPRVAIVGCFRQTAAGQRTSLIAKALQHAGAEVSITSLEPGAGGEWMRSQDSAVAEPVRSSLGNGLLRRAQAVKHGVESLARLVHAGADVVFNYSESWLYSAPVWKIARRYQVRLVQDCVEWYEPVCFGGNGFHPLLLDHSRKRESLAARADGVTVITSRLESLYKERGATTFLLPALCDPLEFENRHSRPAREQRDVLEVVVVASGKPADGDKLLRPILETARSRGARFRVSVIGSYELFEGRSFVGESSESGAYEIVRLAGLSRCHYLQTLACADVFLLPRQSGLHSEAAFPNRVPEFLASGGLLVTTAVGDLPRYIRDGSSGLVCDPGDVSGFASALCWISSHRGAAAEIAENGRRAALSVFDYRVHAEALLRFVLGRPLQSSEERISRQLFDARRMRSIGSSFA